ncbi:MAG: hypothetical protein KY468_17785 [Armatimonadetes bacterium]|nr:hypothetical protein [Armatimonadota bacterium]
MDIPLYPIHAPAPPPDWAVHQRHLFRRMNEAGAFFVRRYTREDGTLVWRDAWPGMDGSDDGYESFFNFPLFYALGGAEEIHHLSRYEWDAVTRQFTAYGQVHNEFDAYYDWMHHGESNLYLYYFGLADPTVEKDRDRALRFAGLYMDEDPDAPNYDPERRLIRSPITGSKGPRFENTAEDWCTHRAVLDNYPPPFDDLPDVPGPKCQWTDDRIFGEILARMNERMMRGDIPLNLTATSLMAHAYLTTGEEKHRQWVLDYIEAWMERTRKNGGIVPDNVGPNGEIGELMGGDWWGGYYGWRWPHGFNHLLEPILIAASNALLLTGDPGWLDFPRTQMDRIHEQGRKESGRWVVPHRHGSEGWYDYRPMNPTPAIHLWALTHDDADRERVERIRAGQPWNTVEDQRSKGEYNHAAPWYAFVRGEFPEYPREILGFTYREMIRRLDAIRHDDGDPAEWDVHHWQDLNPVCAEALVQLTLGAPNTIYHGGLLHAPLRHFDAEGRRPGLPEGVSALVERVEKERVTLVLANTDPLNEKRVTVQAGAFGEHEFTDALLSPTLDPIESQNLGGEIPATQPQTVSARYLEIRLGPNAVTRATLGLKRYAHTPSYVRPWDG